MHSVCCVLCVFFPPSHHLLKVCLLCVFAVRVLHLQVCPGEPEDADILPRHRHLDVRGDAVGDVYPRTGALAGPQWQPGTRIHTHKIKILIFYVNGSI